MKIVILAGGSGTRLFPLSREEFPKQFLQLFNTNSLFQQSILRAKLAVSAKDILILSNKKYTALIKQHLTPLRIHPTVLHEPAKRNTASAIALAAKYLLDTEKAPADTVMFISPSDHMIFGKKRFLTALKRAKQLAKQGYIVTFGIIPSKPHTGYGYIEAGVPIKNFAYKVNSFKEKPELKLAQKYIKSGNYFWNSGMFAFTIQTIVEEFKKYAPEIYSLFAKYNYEQLYKNFSKMPDISIDYAVMEYTKKAAVVPTNIVWSDIGSLESVYDNLEKDNSSNAIRGNIVATETKHSLLLNNNPKQLLATVGVDNLMAIVTEDVITLVKYGEGQKVRDLVSRLKESRSNKIYLKHGRTLIYPWGRLHIISPKQPIILHLYGRAKKNLIVSLDKLISNVSTSNVSIVNHLGNTKFTQQQHSINITPDPQTHSFDLVLVAYEH